MKIVASLTAAALFGVTGSGKSADLEKFSRTIAKEPVYEGRPGYCLLLFGHEAKTRVWLALDAKARRLYVDLNGNGDLTETGKRIAPANHNVDQRVYEVGEIVTNDGRTKYTKLRIEHWGTGPENAVGFAVPESFSLGVEVKGKLQRIQLKALGETLATAPLIHFDGPLTFALFDDSALVRNEKPSMLSVLIGTWSPDRRALTTIPTDDPPLDVHPIAEIEFPPTKPDATPPKLSLIHI